MKTLIKNIHILNPHQKPFLGSLLIENDKIKKIFKGDSRRSLYSAKAGYWNGKDFDKVIEGKGLHCFPGFIDLHCHLREPGFEDCETIESGSRAAAAGGFTTICCMPNTNPVNDHPQVTRLLQQKIKNSSVIKVFPIGAISEGLEGKRLAQIGLCVDEGIIAISDDGKCISSTSFMAKALAYSRQFDIPVVVHAEDPSLVYEYGIHTGRRASLLGLKGSPALAEEVIVARDIVLAERLKARLHIAHVTSWQSVEYIKHAKERGVKVTAEVCPHHLLLTEKATEDFNTLAKVAPPLRSEKHRAALRHALKTDVIDCIATDHAPWSEKYKDLPFVEAACGIAGFETAFSLSYELVQEGVLSLPKLISKLTVEPAKIFGLPKPEIKENSAADLVLVNLEQKYKIDTKNFLSKSKNTPFEGKSVKGKVKYTFCNGQLVYSDQ
ncbi:MAG: dihydroorotase [Deltaproteobacteria bacterium]|nr:dihydroorotase [Deltaproteobacteria bacterium]